MTSNHSIQLVKKSGYIAVIGIISLSFLFASCKKTPAQYPANKINITDSTGDYLREHNKEWIQKEDSAIQVLISSQSVNFTKAESGIWYYIQEKTNLQLLTSGDSCIISYRAHSVGGELYFQEENIKIRFGKKEIPTGLEEGLKMMKKGEKARFIVPSYLAYGAQGTDMIPPYSAVIYIVDSR